MLSKIISSSFVGVESYIVNVEVDISNGFPSFTIVGLGDTAISESKDRVRSAIKNSGIDIFPRKIIINLSPADIKKEGAAFDLPIAVGILSSFGFINKEKLPEYLLIGELSLNGDVRKIKGVISSVIAARENNLKGVIVPYENFHEASFINGVDILPVKNLKEVLDFFNHDLIPKVPKPKPKINFCENNLDFSDVKGQETAKRAMEIVAAGSHNVILNGSPGAGKSMIAKRLPTILPDMTEEEIIQTTKIYSISGLLSKKNPIISKRPFRSPHYTLSDVALIGGGRFPRPGEITLAHNGILFLDEMGEFSKRILEVLRQPLEDKVVTISRASFSNDFPANFILIAATNPCPCGYLFEEQGSKRCVCSQSQIERYRKKISGPILDRIDINLDIKRLSENELLNSKLGESSSKIKERVNKAYRIQQHRYNASRTNSSLLPKELKQYCKIDSESEDILKLAAKKFAFSGRAFDKILKLSRTIADLEASQDIKKMHIIEALSYRK